MMKTIKYFDDFFQIVMINEFVQCISDICEIKTYQNCIMSCFIAVVSNKKKN